MSVTFAPRWLAGLLIVALAAWAAGTAATVAQDDPAEEATEENESESPAEDQEEQADEAAEGEDANAALLKMPDDASPEELMEFIQNLQTSRPQLNSQEERIDFATKAYQVIVEATDKILAAEIDDDTAEAAATTKLRSLTTLKEMGVEGAADDLAKVTDELAADKRPAVAKVAQFMTFVLRFRELDSENADEVKSLVADVIDHVKTTEIDGSTAQLAQAAGQVMAQVAERKEAIATYNQLAELLAKSDDPNIAKMAEGLEGAARQLDMVGKPLEIEGTLVDGSTFDWSAYKGKVVLVDFWATWCGPCIGELPNVKETYEKFHDQGFDVVGISLDEDRDALVQFIEDEKLPWATLFGTTPETIGWQHPMATRYGVSGIPMPILVDREGNVVTLQARGEELPKLVAQLVAKDPPAAANGKARSAAASKTKKAASKADAGAAKKKKAAARKPAAKKPAAGSDE